VPVGLYPSKFLTFSSCSSIYIYIYIYTLHSEWIGLLSILSVYYSMNDIQAVFFQTLKTHASFLLWQFGLHFLLDHVIILKLQTEVPWWGCRRLFPSNKPPPVLPNSEFYSVSRGCQSGGKCKNVPWMIWSVSGWEGIAAGGRYIGGSFI
jgi:hypothetical protein